MDSIQKLKTHPARWTDDCSGKKDVDGEFVTLSVRYWPAGGSHYILDGAGFRLAKDPSIKPSAHAKLLLNGAEDSGVLTSPTFAAETEAEVRHQVEEWADAQWRRLVTAVEREFGQAREQGNGE
jgi:hypothetical protein